MTISRRQAMRVSGTTLAGMSLGLRPEQLLAQAPAAAAPQAFPDTLVDATLGTLLPFRCCPMDPHPSIPQARPARSPSLTCGGIPRARRPRWSTDYRQLKIKVDARGLAKRTGTLTFADLDKLPRYSYVTLLQCGAPNPTGIVKWTGVRFSDLANLLEIQPSAHYCRLIASDKYLHRRRAQDDDASAGDAGVVDERSAASPQHGAPVRLVIPFRYGARSIKAVTDLSFGSPGMPVIPLPA